MLSRDLVWRVGTDGKPMVGVVGDETDPTPTHSFTTKDVAMSIYVPLAEAEEFFRLSAGNNYDEIMRRWAVDPATAREAETVARGYYEIVSVTPPTSPSR